MNNVNKSVLRVNNFFKQLENFNSVIIGDDPISIIKHLKNEILNLF